MMAHNILYNIHHFLNSLSDFVILYILASLIIAILIWVESAWVARNGGKIPQNNLFAVISILTSSWLIVSGLALYFLEFDGVLMSVPVVYGVYSLLGWIKEQNSSVMTYQMTQKRLFYQANT